MLRAAFVVVGAIGVAAYVYRELLARYVVPIYDYTVGVTRRLSERTIEIALDPAAGRRVRPRPVRLRRLRRLRRLAAPPVLDLECRVGPATRGDDQGQRGLHGPARGVAASRRSGQDRRAVRRLHLRDRWPRADLDRRRHRGDAVHQLAALLEGSFDRDVDFYHSVRGPSDAVYREDVEAAATRHPSLRVHFVYSDADAPLTAEDVLRPVADGKSPSIYMCGPPSMMGTLARGFRRHGVPPSRVRWEDFGGR